MDANFRDVIKADLYRYFDNPSRENVSFWRALFFIPGFKFTFFLRKCAYWKTRHIWPVYIFYRLILNHCRFKYGFDIADNTTIGPGFYLGHFGGVVIHPLAVLGKNVNIAHGVTIGKVNRGRKIGVPVIGDKVWIGAHAIVVGNVKIGSGALIGPGAYVNFDVPENAVVIGNPGNIISYDGSDGYVKNILDI